MARRRYVCTPRPKPEEREESPAAFWKRFGKFKRDKKACRRLAWNMTHPMRG